LEQHCSEEILSAYLDGDLESEEAGRTAEHIAECPVCRRSLAQVRVIRDAALDLAQVVPSDRTWRAIQERIQGTRTRDRRLTRLVWFGIPALAAALLLVVLAGRAHLPGSPGKGMAAASSQLSKEMVVADAEREYEEYVRGIDRAIDECRSALGENPGNARVQAAFSGARHNRESAMDRLVSGGE
jgi:anti-sigma factor RsiW